MNAMSFEERQELWRLLEARIAFRKRWAMSYAPKRKHVKPEHIEALNAYDDEYNFARMGIVFVDADWGLPKPKKPSKPRKPQVRRADTIRAAAIATHALNSNPRSRVTI